MKGSNKYFYDTEFLEGKQKKKFLGFTYGETPNTIDLISIGIVSEDNREYYAVCKDFNLGEAWDRHDLKKAPNENGQFYTKDYWIRDNVLKPIYDSWVSGDQKNRNPFTKNTFKRLLKNNGKTRERIELDILQFTLDSDEIGYDGWLGTTEDYIKALKFAKSPKIEFVGYYSAYDHVLLSWIFGKMLNLPKSFPMYTTDVKQMLDMKIRERYPEEIRTKGFKENLDWVKNLEDYPKDNNAHNALYDAIFTKELYYFTEKL